MATELPTSMGIKQSSSLRLTMYVCMYVEQRYHALALYYCIVINVGQAGEAYSAATEFC